VIAGPFLERMRAYDLFLCLACNRAVRLRPIQRLFAVVSRLGDGVFWYALMAVLPVVYGRAGLAASLTMVAAGAAGVLVYKRLKARFVRQRPFGTHADIAMGTAPLDRGSFPSGHTLHAVAFGVITVAWFPALAWLVAPFAALVALSRMVLGLHYPSDVLAGAALGAFFGFTAVQLAAGFGAYPP